MGKNCVNNPIDEQGKLVEEQAVNLLDLWLNEPPLEQEVQNSVFQPGKKQFELVMMATLQLFLNVKAHILDTSVLELV